MSRAHRSALVSHAIDILKERGGIDRDVQISLGGCVEAHGTERVGAMRRSAHAHTSKRDSHRGWLCFKSSKPEVLTTPSGMPTTLLAHEWAHVAVYAGHTKKWVALMQRLGCARNGNKYARRTAARSKFVLSSLTEYDAATLDEQRTEFRFTVYSDGREVVHRLRV